MLYTDTDLFFLQFRVENLAKEINSRPAVRTAFDFGSIAADHPSGLGSPDDPHSGAIGYFKDECGGDPILEFVGLRPKMYSFTKVKATKWNQENPTAAQVIEHKAVAKGISRANISRFTHQDYLQMYREADSERVIDTRIGSKLHQV